LYLAFGSYVAATLLFVAAVIAVALYFSHFNAPFFGSGKHEDWNGFSAFAGFVAQAVTGFATVSGALFVTLIVADQSERRREKDETARSARVESERAARELEARREREARDLEAKRERRSRELIRLSEQMVDTQFYVKVMYPAWEVALKWLGLSGPEGASYRAEVLGAEVRLPKVYSCAQRQEDTFAENNPRYHPHYMPYDQSRRDGAPPPVINELSESLAFATWVRFWRHIMFLIDSDILDPEDVADLLREWYMWWAPFMNEFAQLAKRIMLAVEGDFGPGGISANDKASSINKILELQASVFGLAYHHGHPTREDFEARMDSLFAETYPLLTASIRTPARSDC
jgi:hypothetical protein